MLKALNSEVAKMLDRIYQVLTFLFLLFIIFGCSSPDFNVANEDSQAIVISIEDLVKITDTLDRYYVVIMPTWCSGSEWLVKERATPLSDSLEFNNIPYFFIILGNSYASIADFVRKNNLNKPYYLIKDEWQGNGFLDRLLVNKISRCLRVERRDNGVPFGFYFDKKNQKIAYSVYDYKYISSKLEDYKP
jgi:hypothetical protein